MASRVKCGDAELYTRGGIAAAPRSIVDSETNDQPLQGWGLDDDSARRVRKHLRTIVTPVQKAKTALLAGVEDRQATGISQKGRQARLAGEVGQRSAPVSPAPPETGFDMRR